MKTIPQRHQLLDAIWSIQDKQGYIADHDVDFLANEFNISNIDVEGVISFYHFFKRKPSAKYTIYLNNSIASKFHGFSKVKQAMESGTGVLFEKTDPSDTFELHETSCVGLSDLEPAALINFRPFTNLTAQKVHQIISNLKSGKDLDEICDDPDSILYYTPPTDKTILLRPHIPGKAIEKLKTLSPQSIITFIKSGNLTGMGGAFFPTHYKWESCRKKYADPKYVICNADEGEPGTFKDRYLLKNYPKLVLEGMIMAAYTVGGSEGVIYLRAEYRFLRNKIEAAIQDYRDRRWLGNNILGIKGFNFDVRVQLGGGAYVCGEETALLQSLEGYRGEPRPKVNYPTEKGFLGKPTIVNNVETLCMAARILELGVEYINNTGHQPCPGTKLISVAGDVEKPGIYEIEWGMPVHQLLDICGAQNPSVIQVSGPSGELIFEDEFDRLISLDDLRCGGSFMVFNPDRNLLEIIQNNNQFFINESCGVCTPCRAGNFILSRQLNKVRRGLLDQNDITQIKKWSEIMKYSSRCGLGQTAPNSLIQTLDKKPQYFEQYLAEETGLNRNFNLEEATHDYDEAIKKNE